MFEFARGGRPTPEWSVYETVLSDATGNTSRPWDCQLCPHESAWKLRARFRRRAGARFAPEESWTIPARPAPKPGQVISISQTRTLQGVGIEVVALAGPGGYRYENDKPISGVTSPEELSRIDRSGGFTLGSSTTIVQGVPTVRTEITCGDAHLALRVVGLGPDQVLAISAVDDRGRVAAATSSSSSDDRYFYVLPVRPDAKRLTLRVAVDRLRTAEFLIRPPRFTSP